MIAPWSGAPYSRPVTEPVVIPRGSGEIVGDTRDRRVEILSDDETVNVTWSRFGPHRDGADLHVHRHHSDLFYVLEGEFTLLLGSKGDSVSVPAGTLARVPPLVVHGFRNASDAEMRYLNLHAPGERFADYLRALRDGRRFSYDQHPPPADAGRPASEAVVGGDLFLVNRPDSQVRLLADVEEIAVAEISASDDGRSPVPHVHGRHAESFYVLDGELKFEAGGREFFTEPGSWVQIPSGVPHKVAVRGPRRARFLNLHSPSSGFGRFLRSLDEDADDTLAATRAGFDQLPE